MARAQRPQEESPRARALTRARAMKARYIAMPSPRSLHALAKIIRAEETRGDNRPRAVSTIERQLKEWSRDFGWVEAATQADIDRAQEEQRRREESLQRMNDAHAEIAERTRIRVMERINTLLDEDDMQYTGYLEAALAARMDSRELPRRPKPTFGPYALVQLAKLSFDEERLARGAATEIVQSIGMESALPPVMEIRLTSAPPPEPPDPFAAKSLRPGAPAE